MSSQSPVEQEKKECRVLVVTWVPPQSTPGVVRTNHAVTEALGSRTLGVPPQGASKEPTSEGPLHKVHTSVQFVGRSYPEMVEWVKNSKFRDFDAVLIMGFADGEKPSPNVILGKGARRLGYGDNEKGNKGDAQLDGQYGFKGDKDYYESNVNVESAMAALKERGYNAVETQDFRTEGYPAVGVPYYCEYVYGQLLRAVESKGKPLVLHTHMTFVKGQKGHEGGPYTLPECIELTKCLVWYLAGQSTKI